MNKTIILSVCLMSALGAAAASTDAKEMTTCPPVVAGQPVDLTVAAEKALPCVVHIKYLLNSKIQDVEVENDPFGDFFDPFGFFGQRNQGQGQKRKVQTP